MNEAPGLELDQPSAIAEEEDIDNTSLSLFDKKLRLADPDLEITVRDGHREKTFHHYSIMMASFYGFFDSLLSSGMKESLSKKVNLEDVDPEVFELATSLLDNQLRLKDATIYDFLKVASFYHRYDSKPGLDLVEEYLGDFLDSWTKNEERQNPTPQEMRFIVATILFSEEAQIEHLLEKSKHFVTYLLAENKLFAETSIPESYIKDMKPFLVAHPESLQAFLQKYCQTGMVPEYSSKDFATWLHSKFVAVRNCLFWSQLPFFCWEVHVQWQDHGQSRHKQATCSGLVSSSVNYCLIGKFSNLNIDPTFIYAKVTLAQYCMLPSSIQLKVNGTVGIEFQYTDWILFIQRKAFSLGFAFPFSGSMMLPPVGYGWKQLSGADRCAARIRLEYNN